ncbi:MAG: hypothetical protein AAGC93_16385 [Cyanobacteria bacterium P01_F01_bin.53]
MWNLLKSGASLLIAFALLTLFFTSVEKGNLKVGEITDDGLVMFARIYRAVTTPLPDNNQEQPR